MSNVFQGRQQHGWDTTSQDYHAHRREEAPTVLVEVPRYPNVYKAFNNKVIIEEEPEIQQQQHLAKPEKKVHISEQKQIIVEDSNGNREVIEESIDVEADGFIKQKHKGDAEADGFIKQKHKGFELCKWKTFKTQ